MNKVKKLFVLFLAIISVFGFGSINEPVTVQAQVRTCVQLRDYFVSSTTASSVMSGSNGTGVFIVAAQPGVRVTPIAAVNSHGWRRISFRAGGTNHVGYIRNSHLSFRAVYACQ